MFHFEEMSLVIRTNKEGEGSCLISVSCSVSLLCCRTKLKIRLFHLQVSVDDNFWKAMEKIKSIEIRKKAISVLMKLSSDSQWPRTEHITVLIGVSNQLFELCPVNGILHIVLTFETIMETSSHVDVMRVWDIWPLTEIPNLDPMFILCKQLDAFHLKDEL